MAFAKYIRAAFVAFALCAALAVVSADDTIIPGVARVNGGSHTPFGNIRRGSSPAALPISLSNIGDSAWDYASIEVVSGDAEVANVFAVSTSGSSRVAPGETSSYVSVSVADTSKAGEYFSVVVISLVSESNVRTTILQHVTVIVGNDDDTHLLGTKRTAAFWEEKFGLNKVTPAPAAILKEPQTPIALSHCIGDENEYIPLIVQNTGNTGLALMWLVEHWDAGANYGGELNTGVNYDESPIIDPTELSGWFYLNATGFAKAEDRTYYAQIGLWTTPDTTITIDFEVTIHVEDCGAGGDDDDDETSEESSEASEESDGDGSDGDGEEQVPPPTDADVLYCDSAAATAGNSCKYARRNDAEGTSVSIFWGANGTPCQSS